MWSSTSTKSNSRDDAAQGSADIRAKAALPCYVSSALARFDCIRQDGLVCRLVAGTGAVHSPTPAWEMVG